ncbi:MAG: C-GCAxxG-C-C family protein [Spirochaetota bacterium]
MESQDASSRSSLADRAAYWYTEEDMNCAESLLHGCADYYHLSIQPADMRVAAGFGSGMQIKSVCGALTGAIMAAGLLFIRDRAHETELLSHLVPHLLDTFEQRYGTISCAILREKYHTEEEGCLETVRLSAEVVEEVFSSFEGEMIRQQP